MFIYQKLVIVTNYFNVINEFITEIENNNKSEIDIIILNIDVIIEQD